MPRATHGIFVNFEDDGTILFRGMQRRGERTAFSFARTVLPDLHRTAIPIHRRSSGSPCSARGGILT